MFEFDRLKNVTVTSILLKDGEVIINDKVKLSAYGDCCSTGWLSNLEAPSVPFVLSGQHSESEDEVVASDDPDFPENGDYVVRQDVSFETDNGALKFKMWNDSNGYYGSMLQIDCP